MGFTSRNIHQWIKYINFFKEIITTVARGGTFDTAWTWFSPKQAYHSSPQPLLTIFRLSKHIPNKYLDLLLGHYCYCAGQSVHTAWTQFSLNTTVLNKLTRLILASDMSNSPLAKIPVKYMNILLGNCYYCYIRAETLRESELCFPSTSTSHTRSPRLALVINNIFMPLRTYTN